MKMLQKKSSAIDLKSLVDRGVEFHGHLGPFLVCGIRMGLVALDKLNSTGHKDLSVVSYSGKQPPFSCLNDGVQISTGCTLGKGNITVRDKGQARIIFEKEKNKLEISLKDFILDKIEYKDIDSYSKELMDIPEEELFEWKRI